LLVKGTAIMPQTISLTDAQSNLREVIEHLLPGEEVVIVVDGQPVAKLTPAPRTLWPCQPGTAKDTSHWMADDFDAPLEDFREYM
jgi:antitoxin (DNA-binding transcriptional repressor) of toxin-antitoxin stability system